MAEFHPLPPSSGTKWSPNFDALNKAAEERARECEPAVLPSLEHLSWKDYDRVYEPSDDTYLLLDGISLAFQSGMIPTQKHTTLEIGSGTGVPTVYLAQRLQKWSEDKDHVHHVTDINPYALEVSQATAKANSVSLILHECDLVTPLLKELENAVDIVLFNPPYVPTPDDELGSTGIECSWAGGKDGRQVINRAISQLARTLAKPNGQIFMITVDDNAPEDLAQQFANVGLNLKPWVRRRARNEYLTVQRLTWANKEPELM
mmetsp:Transcript_20178/g.29951  ORF Transcript_20178/g.29951 Transcript_20178/m.29951 type:complete len:261 (+) Transcript_20178:255-1037(+)